MALQKQLVPMPTSRGLDTKIDPKQEEAGYYRKSENIVYETLKLFRKRNGYDSLSLDILGGSEIEGALKLARLNTELVTLTSDSLYSYSQNRMQWSHKGTLYPVNTTNQTVYKSAGSQTNVDGFVVDGFKVFAWEDSTTGVRYSVQDLDDDSFLISNGTVEAGAERPVVSAINNDVYIIYGNGADVKFKTFSILEPQTLSAATVVASNRDTTDGLIDAQSAGTAIAVAYNADNAGNNLSIFKINSDGSNTSVIGVTGEEAPNALNVYVDPQSRFLITYSDGTDFKIIIYAFNLNAAILGPTLVDTVLGAAATATLNLTNDIILTASVAGTSRNTNTLTTTVAAAAANPTDTVLVSFTGTAAAVTVTITPNDGTNNGAVPVNLTTAELVELINTGAVTGKTITLTDGSSLRTLATATGGGAQNMVDGGEGDNILATFSGGTILPVTTCTTIIDGTNYKTYYEVAQAGVSDNYIKQASITLGGTVSGISVFQRSVGLASDAFKVADTTYISTVHESGLQSTYFLFNAAGTLVTKWANQIAGSVLTGVLPGVTTLPNGSILIASQFRNRIVADGASFYGTTGIGAVILNFNPEFYYSNAELAGGLHICAGVLKYYDGATLTEHGFCVFPEVLSAFATATTGGFLTNGNRGYVAVYKWTDNNGRDHRSAPTLTPLEVVLSGGTSTQTSTIRVPTLRVTDKTNVVLELYRTEDAGTNFYKVTNDLSPVLNSKTVDYIDIVDGLSDEDLIANEPLYTTGDVLENVPAPAAYQVCAYNGDRLVIVGENENRVYFSKTTTEEGPVEFTDLIYRDIQPVGGPITTIANMASKLVIFAQDATFYVSGEGPLNTGVQDSFTKPETVASDLGCIQPDSVVLTPKGLLFKSRKGIWELTGGLTMQYTGDRVEAYNGDTVTAASIVGDLNQVRFLLSEQRALVYNYDLNLWATFENHGGQSSIVIGNQYYYLNENSSVYAENRQVYADNSSPIKMRLESGWLTQTELQGYQRVYQMMILGSFKSSHKLRVRIAYDFIDAFVDEVIIDPTDFIDPTTYGGDEFYGATSPYGGDGNLYQVRVDMQQQKCQAIKFSIEDVQGSASEGLTLSAITFRVGVKEGFNKLQASQQAGTE
jgi:hypothetical protein